MHSPTTWSFGKIIQGSVIIWGSPLFLRVSSVIVGLPTSCWLDCGCYNIQWKYSGLLYITYEIIIFLTSAFLLIYWWGYLPLPCRPLTTKTEDMFQVDVATTVPMFSIIAILSWTFILWELAQTTKVFVSGPLILLYSYSRAETPAHKLRKQIPQFTIFGNMEKSKVQKFNWYCFDAK